VNLGGAVKICCCLLSSSVDNSDCCFVNRNSVLLSMGSVIDLWMLFYCAFVCWTLLITWIVVSYCDGGQVGFVEYGLGH